jgi:predicted ATP-dependent endonuclease of OLD family
MKLENVQITNFRCIDDSTPFAVGQVTCLVGKNESGKTSVLHALTRLNSTDSSLSQFDKERDYPRKMLTDFDEDTRVLETKWLLDDEDVAAVEKVLGAGALPSKNITIQKTYDKDGKSIWPVTVEEKKIIEWLLHEAGCDANERKHFESCTTIKDFVSKAEPLKATSPRITTILEKIAKWRKSDPTLAAIDILYKRMPKFLYFASYDRMDGNVSLEKLKTDVANGHVSRNDLVFLAFLDFAGTALDELAKLDRYEVMKARVEAASIKISKQIFKYWSQNRHLKVQFSLEAGRAGDAAPFNSGNIMRTRILNMLHDMTVPFDDRSAGFVWFFSFLVLFSQVKKKHGNVIILLDEPGLNLHAKAQADLLKFISEELKPHHQVIYSTHSPFMVASDDLAGVRTVEDVVKYAADGRVEAVLGTKVGDQVLSTDKDTLFPLQGALGYEITQTLFVGKHTLVVEGPSDILYLQAASAELGRRGRTKLDLRWTPCPAGSVDKVAAFLSLFGGNKLHVAVLVDYAQGQKGKIESLRKSKILQDGHVFTTTDFCAQAEADIEDFFGADLYVELINGTYNLTGNNKLTVAEVQAAQESSLRIVKKVEAVLRLKPALPEFDHYSPAMFLVQNPKLLNPDNASVNVALDRFENLFKKLNALL